MATAENPDQGKALSPPYTAYQSLKSLIASAHEHGSAPGRYDRTVLSNYAGNVAGQLLLALRFLKLTDDGGIPLPAFEALRKAYGTGEWRAQLGERLKAVYGPVFGINLETATPGQFSERFKDAFQIEGETLRKATTFFLNAAADAGIPISPYIMKGKKPRSAPTKRRSSKIIGAKPAGELESSVVPRDPPPEKGEQRHRGHRLPSLIAALIEALPDDGKTWSMEDASDWMQTAAYNFRFAYKLPEVLKVEITWKTKGKAAGSSEPTV